MSEYILQITKNQTTDFLKKFSHSNKSFHVEFHAGSHGVQCNRLVLEWWSSSYRDIVLGGNIIKIERFRDRIKLLQDCVELLHGRKVRVSIADVHYFYHFAKLLDIRELLEAVDGIRTANGMPALDIGKDDKVVSLNRSSTSASLPRPHSAIVLPRSSTSAYIHPSDLDYITEYRSDSATSLTGGSGYKAERRQSLTQRISGVFKSSKQHVKGTLASASSTPESVLPDPLRRHQLWKTYSADDLVKLRGNSQILEFMFVEVFLAWVSHHKPSLSVVNKIYDTIIEENLNLTYISCILSHLDDMYGYKVTKNRFYNGDSMFVCLSWDIPKGEQRELFVESQSLRLRAGCTFEDCLYGKAGSKTVVTVQLNNVAGYCSMKIIRVDLKPNEHQHSTWRYQNWFIFGIRNNICEVCSIYTSSHSQIKDFVYSKDTVMLRCLYEASIPLKQSASMRQKDTPKIQMPG